MKKTALTFTVFAAAMLASASNLPAQTMKAEIPFSFEASGARMQPGTYAVEIGRTLGGQPLLRILNWDTHGSILALPSVEPARSPDSAAPALTFVCQEGRCALQQLRDGGANRYRLQPVRFGPGETRIATVLLRPDKAD